MPSDYESRVRQRIADLRAFVIAWQSSEGVAAVALAIGMTEREASNLAAYLRRRRVPLKRMPPRQMRTPGVYICDDDMDELRKIAKQ